MLAFWLIYSLKGYFAEFAPLDSRRPVMSTYVHAEELITEKYWTLFGPRVLENFRTSFLYLFSGFCFFKLMTEDKD